MIQQRSISVGLELITMDMIKELHALFAEPLASAVEDGDRVATLFLREVLRVRDPSAADVLQAEGFGVPANPIDVVSQAFIREVAGNGLQVVGIQQRFEL